MSFNIKKYSPLIESWKHVAAEALEHPYQSGLTDMALGAMLMAGGAYCRDPAAVKAGALVVGIGFAKLGAHHYCCRHPLRSSLTMQ